MRNINSASLVTENLVNRSITNSDSGRILFHIHDSLQGSRANQSPEVLHHLYLMTAVGQKYNPNEIPENVVTMNSEIILIQENQKRQSIRIVYPEDITFSSDRSIYSPLGSACIGAKEKSYVFYEDETGKTWAYIEEIIFQPEKEKIFNL